MSFVGLSLGLLAWLGHAAFWQGLGNRWHATGFPRRPVKIVAALLHVAQFSILGLMLAWSYFTFVDGRSRPNTTAIGVAAWYYILWCWSIAAVLIPSWCWQRWTDRRPTHFISAELITVDLAAGQPGTLVSGWKGKIGVALPGNQLFHVEVAKKVLGCERLPRELDGFRIAHLSDLHFSGRVHREFFERAVEVVNDLQPGLIAITGDVCDVRGCLEWIPQTLGRLCARFGVYFILGNHDLRIDTVELRQTLASAGLIDVGGRWLAVDTGGAALHLAGNERPWFTAAAPLDAPLPRRVNEPRPFRVLLSHSPDQIDWARRGDFDLMLAGHTHGGQIRLPLIGPVVCPSRYGVRYASGLFFRPPTLMHVLRGLSSLTPLRFNCPPEIALLELRANS